ncbi:ParA family protein [Burkholderia sp. Tr-20390]|uniref:ParA family protein n=1 Tax=Burkholderia sp. Tr-20390 TaxID=2703904 RepID=UPI00197EDADF|nr:ParA family protein [Burkholderia sp. Tr-20390]MBN3735402.1 ParA family protein [Burkholderia sp. Tr-20390]
MGTVVTVMNMKGGVGKTTVTANIAGFLSQYKSGKKNPKFRKILVIDYDPQFNLSQIFLPPTKYFSLEESKKTCLTVLADDNSNVDPFSLQVPGNISPPKVAEIATEVFRPAANAGGLDIVPSTLDLMYVALGRASHQTKRIEERFGKFIEECRSIYDLVFIDCHPAGSLLTNTSLSNSDHVLIPVAPQSSAVRGVGLMMKFIESRVGGNRGVVPHILFNSVPRVKISNEESVIRGIKGMSNLCLSKSLKRYSAFGEAQNGVGFVWKSGKPYSTEAFLNLAEVANEFVDRI